MNYISKNTVPNYYKISRSNVSKIAQRELNEHLQNGYDGEIIICCFTEADAKYFI